MDDLERWVEKRGGNVDCNAPGCDWRRLHLTPDGAAAAGRTHARKTGHSTVVETVHYTWYVPRGGAADGGA